METTNERLDNRTSMCDDDDDNDTTNAAKGKEVWNEQGKGRERTEERSQSTDRPSIAEAEHKGEREREESESPQILTNAATSAGTRCFPPYNWGR